MALDPAGALRSTVQPAEDKQYQRIAADLRGAILCGALKPGDKLPTVVDIASRYSVAFNTAQRAVEVLKKEGLVSASRGRRAVVAQSGITGQGAAEVVSMRGHRGPPLETGDMPM